MGGKRNPRETANCSAVPLQTGGDEDDGDQTEREAIQTVDLMPELPAFMARRRGHA